MSLFVNIGVIIYEVMVCHRELICFQTRPFLYFLRRLPKESVYGYVQLAVLFFPIFQIPLSSYVAFSLRKSLTGQTPATFPEIINIAATGYGVKFFLAASLTPALYALKSIMSDKFGLVVLPADVDEENTPTTVPPPSSQSRAKRM